MKIRLVTDSTTDLSEAARGRVTVVPLTVRFGEEEYLDGVTIDHRRFYEKLVESDALPSTSQPSPEAFAKVYQEAIDQGEQVLVITISSALSGTYQSASIAAMEFPEESVYVVDSKNATIASGVLTDLALSLIDAGMSAGDIAKQLEEERENVRLIALLDTLEFLKRGGRISKTVAFAGGLLSIKPVICIEDGVIKTLGKARGSKQGNNLLVQEIERCGGVDFSRPVMLGYTGLSDALLQKYITDSAALWEAHLPALRSTCIGSTIGTHAGPGAIAVAFFRKAN